MCKKFSFVLLGLLGIYLLQAQETAKPLASNDQSAKMEFGFHGGPGSSIFFNEHPHQNPRNGNRPVYFGGMAGLSYQYNFTKMAALHVEANYERKGDIYYSIAGWDNAEVFHERYAFDRVSYITIPVTARMSFGNRIRFFFDAGLYAGLQISAQRVISDTRYTPVIDIAINDRTSVDDINKDIRTMDGGAVFGIGLFLPVGDRVAFTLQARDHAGFANLNANTGLYQNKFYNNSMAVLMGLSFALDKPYNFGPNKKNAPNGRPLEQRY
jgi:hypothetical protein